VANGKQLLTVSVDEREAGVKEKSGDLGTKGLRDEGAILSARKGEGGRPEDERDDGAMIRWVTVASMVLAMEKARVIPSAALEFGPLAHWLQRVRREEEFEKSACTDGEGHGDHGAPNCTPDAGEELSAGAAGAEACVSPEQKRRRHEGERGRDVPAWRERAESLDGEMNDLHDAAEGTDAGCEERPGDGIAGRPRDGGGIDREQSPSLREETSRPG